MKKSLILIALASILVIAALTASGCGQTPQPEPQTEIPTGGATAETEEETTITITSAPSSAKVGDQTTITWKVEGAQKKASHTAIHYDYKSHPGKYDETMTFDKTGYPDFTKKYASGSYDTPESFTDTITLGKEGVLYYRAHVIIEGENYWTPEKSILARPKEKPAQQPIEPVDKTYTIEANDLGYYMNGAKIESITADRGDKIRVKFNVSKDNVYYGGLDFKGCGVSGGAKPGESTSLVLSTYNSCSITSFWPSSAMEKSKLNIKVSTTSTGGGGY